MAGAIKPKLNVGACVVILPGFEARQFLQVLSDYKITKAGGVPAVFSMLLQHRDLIESLDFSALKELSIGSAPVAEELMEQIEAAFGVKVGESYGLTEGGPVMIGPPLDGRRVPFGSCGVAWPEGEVKLVGADGKDHPSFGELWVRNPGVTPGYHNLPKVNAERLVDGWLRTGDLFSLDEAGFFYFRGRTDDMFNCGGENIYPKEVENLLLAHPAVVDACVVPVSHALKGAVPAALVMLTKRGAATAEELKQHCLENGPAYAHPRQVRHRRCDSLERRRQERSDDCRPRPRGALRRRRQSGRDGMSFSLDHVAVVVPDLDAAAERLSKARLPADTAGARIKACSPPAASAPWGTGNHCAMFKRGYFEILGITDPALPHENAARRLRRYAGLHLIAFGTVGCDSGRGAPAG